MRKKIIDEYVTKAKIRQQKKRLRMKVHSRSLLSGSRHAGKKIIVKNS